MCPMALMQRAKEFIGACLVAKHEEVGQGIERSEYNVTRRGIVEISRPMGVGRSTYQPGEKIDPYRVYLPNSDNL